MAFSNPELISDAGLLAEGVVESKTMEREERVLCPFISGPIGMDVRYFVTSFELAGPGSVTMKCTAGGAPPKEFS